MTTAASPGGTTPGATERRCFDCGRPSGRWGTCVPCETRCPCGDRRCHGCDPYDPADNLPASAAVVPHPQDDGSPYRLEVFATDRQRWDR